MSNGHAMAPRESAQTITEHMVPVACDLIGRVRDGNRQAVLALLNPLTPTERYALTVVLAAMVPDDRSARDLLSWTEDEPSEPLSGPIAYVRPLRPCGTHAAYWRHKKRGEPIDLQCLYAERAYQRARKSNRRQVA
jgi:hypothetical protein